MNFSLSSSGIKELRKRLFFTLIALIVYRIGVYIPVPGLEPEHLSRLFNQQINPLVSHFNMISGGALGRFTLFALGLSPYISASIIMQQLLPKIVPSLGKLMKEGESGQRRLNQYTRYLTMGLACIQSFISTRWIISLGVTLSSTINFYCISILTLVAGALFLMWLGEQITERGMGNGISLIIFAGIISDLPSAVLYFIEELRQGKMNVWVALLTIAIVITVVNFVVFMERAQRKITVHYPQRQQGRRMYAAQVSHLPLKLNMSGVLPTIFASIIVIVPSMLIGWTGFSENSPFLKKISLMLLPGQPLYMILLSIAIVFFCFFYLAFMFNPTEIADNLKKSGAFIPGLRPGEQSAQYLDGVMTRLTVVGCMYLLLVVLLPSFMVSIFETPFAFGGTSLLISVVVVIEFVAQVQSLMMSHQYESLLKKAKLKGLSTK